MKLEQDKGHPGKPLVSIILPAYNEEAIIKKNITILCEYLETLKDRYNWEILIINDGSTDQTGPWLNQRQNFMKI